VSVFEVLMLVCFGISWPVSIVKSLRTKVVAGKSPLFMAILCVGYAFGVTHKVLYSCDWVTVLYGLNMTMVAIDLGIYYRYLPREGQAPAGT